MKAQNGSKLRYKMRVGIKIGVSFLMGLFGVMLGTTHAQDGATKTLSADELFPTDRVLDVRITVDPKDWDILCNQERGFLGALSESRQFAPPERPYTYVDASVSIDGVGFPQVAIRKKGFIGSGSNVRPSLKIKLNHSDKAAQIDGMTNLTFNNCKQDVSLISQHLCYRLFRAAGSPAPRSAFANVIVNGRNLGIYAHVERIHRPLLNRAFGNDEGVLFEGTVVDFNPGWEGSFEHKIGPEEAGRTKIVQLIDVLAGSNENGEAAIGALVDLDSFYPFWALESLVGFWDGYSGNRNNFFLYLNPDTDKFHFIPWGADSVFEKYSQIRDDRNDPVSVKTQGLIAHRLYQLESGRKRYEQALRTILDRHWDEASLIAETERVEALVTPYLAAAETPDSSEEAQGWIEWLRNASPQERVEALNSEEFKELTTETQQAIRDGIRPAEPGAGTVWDNDNERRPKIIQWSLLGPFHTQKRHDLDQDFLLEHGGEVTLAADASQEFQNSKKQTLKWRSVSGQNEIIRLTREIGRLEDVTAYAFCEIESSVAEYVEFGFGSDDTAKVWINGNVVHQHQGEGRTLVPDQDRFTVKLNQGANRCLVKVSQGMGDWGFALRPLSRFPLSEGTLVSGTLLLEGANKDAFPSVRIKAIVDSGAGPLTINWGSAAHREAFQRVIHSAKGDKLRLQALVRGVVLTERSLDLHTNQEQAIDLVVDTDSPAAAKILNWGAAQSSPEFVRALEERRRFIRERRDGIIPEIENGMPQWESRPASPFVFKQILGLPIPIENPVGVAKFIDSYSKGSMAILAGMALCCFPFLGRKHTIHWYFQALKKSFTYRGRARRKEFWMFQLFTTLISWTIPIILGKAAYTLFDSLDIGVAVYGLSFLLYGILSLIANLAVYVRRLHDLNRNGWWLFINVIPFIGWLLTLIWSLSPSQAGSNRYGPNPKLMEQV